MSRPSEPPTGARRARARWRDQAMVGFVRLGSRLPRGAAMRLGAWLGDAFRVLNPKRRAIARINLDLCFPELAPSARARLLRDHYRAYGRSVVDLGLAWWASDARFMRHVTIEGLDALRERLREGRPVLLITPHMIGVDYGGIAVSSAVPVVSMMNALKSPLLNEMVRRGRTRFGAEVVTRDEGLRPLLRGMRRGSVGYYMPDGDYGMASAVFAPFFGVPAATLTTVARIARHVDVASCITRLAGREGYHVSIGAPISDFPSDDPIRDAACMNAVLERGIRTAPEQYMWTLKWFKTRPGEAPAPY